MAFGLVLDKLKIIFVVNQFNRPLRCCNFVVVIRD